MSKTSIEWCDYTINPIRARSKVTGKVFHWCEKVSKGCANCYAEKLAHRFGLPAYVKANRDQVEFFLDKTKLREVLRLKKPSKVFWEDCSDLFGDWVPDPWLDECFAVMALAHWHVYQVLTKRPERMLAYFGDSLVRQRIALGVRHLRRTLRLPVGGEIDNSQWWPLPNVWLGVSAEDRACWLKRTAILRQIPAAVRFVSAEPLLEDLGEIDLAGIHWVIIGGESGPDARACRLDRVRSIVRQCRAACVAPFVKQLGSRAVVPAAPDGYMAQDQVQLLPLRLRDPKGANPTEWPEDLRVREYL